MCSDLIYMPVVDPMSLLQRVSSDGFAGIASLIFISMICWGETVPPNSRNVTFSIVPVIYILGLGLAYMHLLTQLY
jgi:hypothetical protein